MGPLQIFVFCDVDLRFQGQTFQVAILSTKVWKQANSTLAIRLEVMYLPSHCATANVVHHDLDLHYIFEVTNLKRDYLKNWVRTGEKCSSMTFIKVDIAIESDHFECFTP